MHSQASAQDLEPRNGWVTLRPDNTLLMALGKQGPTRLTAEDLRLRSLEQHDQFWKVGGSNQFWCSGAEILRPVRMSASRAVLHMAVDRVRQLQRGTACGMKSRNA